MKAHPLYFINNWVGRFILGFFLSLGNASDNNFLQVLGILGVTIVLVQFAILIYNAATNILK